MSADKFQAFLAENKIDLDALSRPDSEHESKLTGPEQRALGIIKARIEQYPFNQSDMYELRANNLANWTRAIGNNCFEACSQRDDVPFLTVKEGLCFRNCITKFSSWYPTLNNNLENASYRFYEKKLDEITDADNRADPWENARDKMVQRLLNPSQ